MVQSNGSELNYVRKFQVVVVARLANHAVMQPRNHLQFGQFSMADFKPLTLDSSEFETGWNLPPILNAV